MEFKILVLYVLVGIFGFLFYTSILTGFFATYYYNEVLPKAKLLS